MESEIWQVFDAFWLHLNGIRCRYSCYYFHVNFSFHQIVNAEATRDLVVQFLHTPGVQYPSGNIDAINFETNRDVILQGYPLWGVHSGSTTFQITIRLYRGSFMIAEKTGSYYTRSTDKTFEVHFSQQISICAGLLNTATAAITASAWSFFLDDGMSMTSCMFWAFIYP